MSERVRVHVSIEPQDLAKIDRAAASAGQDRSSFLVDAALEIIETRSERVSRKDVGAAFRAIAEAMEGEG